MRIIQEAKFSPLRSRRENPAATAESLERRQMLNAAVLQWHNDVTNSGVNSQETVLNPSNVNVSQFRKNFSTPVDGQVYAQPLFDPNVNITTPAQAGIHNVIFVATENDKLYAIDADGGTVLWSDSFVDKNTPGVALPGETAITTMPAADTKSQDINPNIGITGTPTIDPNTGMLYVAAKTKQIVASLPHYVYTLYKVNIQDGSIAASTIIGDTTFNSGVGYTYNSGAYVLGDGAGYTTVNGQKRVYFNAMRALNRGGLIIQDGSVYFTSASHGDNGPYHGWFIGFDENSLALTGVLNTTPNGSEGGIWMGASPPAVDPEGFFYVATGNGSFNTASSNFDPNGFPKDANYGDADLKIALDPTTSVTNQNSNGWGLKIVDFFSPYNNGALNSVDKDFGSGGILILPDSDGSAAHPHLMLNGGKEGKLYLIDRDDMGKFNASTDNVVQEQASILNGIYDTPAFFNNTIYYVGSLGDTGKAFSISDGAFATKPSSVTKDSFGYPGSTPSISADGTTNGIVWDVDRSTNQLRAYDANNYGNELWTSGQDSSRDAVGTIIKYSVPTPVNGHVYLGVDGALDVYGPPIPATSAPTAPSALLAKAVSGIEIDLSWQDNSNNEQAFNIEESTDGGKTFKPLASVGVNVQAYNVTNLTVGTTYTFRVYATNGVGNSGYSNSQSATTTTSTPVVNFSTGFASSSGLLKLNGNAKLNGSKIQLVDGGKNEQGSAFTTSKLDVTHFNTSFTFQVTNPSADGFAFVLQNNASTSLGTGSQSLGYGGLKNSIAIKFDLYSNAGEGTNSTGLYTNGATPTVPATALTTSAINLHSGDVFLDSIAYDGVTLSNTITDTKTNASLTQNYSINIPTVINSSSAFAGFTGATGGLASTQAILTWTYTPTPTMPPPAPSDLQLAAASATQINLSWQDNSTNEDGFKIYRSSDGTSFDEIGTTAANITTYMDGGLDTDQLYYYQITATNSVGDSDPTDTESLITPVPPPTPSIQDPTLLSPYEVDLSWINNADNATGYQILREPQGESEFIPIANLPPDATSFNDTTVLPGVNYDYHIQCYNIAGYSDFAGINLTTPLAPPITVTAAASDQTVTLTWTPIASADTYNIYRSTDPGDEGATPYYVGTTNDTTFTDSGLTDEQTYYYTVTSLNSLTPESAQSTEILATPVPQSAGPTGLNAAANNDGSITVSWDPIPGASHYNVYRSTTSGAEILYAEDVANPSLVDTGITDLTQTYYYTVTAVTTTESLPSNEISATAQFAVHINFTTPSGEAVPGYLKDTGGKYPVTNGRYTYGWNINNSANTRDRDVKGDPDELHDSLIHLDKQSPSAVWTIAVPNGTYSVHLLVGDPSNYDSVYHLAVNGKAVITATPSSANRWFAGTVVVTVTNGKITVGDASGGKNGKFDAIDITSITAPLTLAATPGNGQVKLSWTAVAGALYYNIYRGTLTTGEGLAPYATNIAGPSFVDTSAPNGKTYYYEITAVTLTGESVVGNETKAAPSTKYTNTAFTKASIAAMPIATPTALFSNEILSSDDPDRLHLLGVLDA